MKLELAVISVALGPEEGAESQYSNVRGQRVGIRYRYADTEYDTTVCSLNPAYGFAQYHQLRSHSRTGGIIQHRQTNTPVLSRETETE